MVSCSVCGTSLTKKTVKCGITMHDDRKLWVGEKRHLELTSGGSAGASLTSAAVESLLQWQAGVNASDDIALIGYAGDVALDKKYENAECVYCKQEWMMLDTSWYAQDGGEKWQISRPRELIMEEKWKILRRGVTKIMKRKVEEEEAWNYWNSSKSETDEYVTLKRSLGFLYGFLLGVAFYELILVDLNFTQYAALFVGGIITLMLSCGIAFSSQIRCITLLSLPVLGGKGGRGVLKTLVLAYIISGPIQNLSNNGLEVVRVFSCTTSLTYNLTKTRFELMFKPFTQALFGLKGEYKEVKDTISSIREVSAPIVGEIEDEQEMLKLKEENDYVDSLSNDSKRSKEIDEKYETKGEIAEAEKFEKMYLKKIEMRCEDQFSKADKNCRKMFQTGYDKCYDTVTWIAAWLLCWPMKLTFVCNIIGALGGSNRCDPSKDMDSGFGEGYSYLKASRKIMSQNLKDVKIQYQVIKMDEIIDLRDATDTAKAVFHTVKIKKDLLDSLLTILKRALAFIFLRIILNSQEYHDKYLRNIDYDNIYITKYFKHIDARRHKVEKKTLLPLKKIERNKLIDPWSIKPLKSEREAIVGQTSRLLLEMVTATTFIILDRSFYEVLDLVRRHAEIKYTQTGHHDMMLKVEGTGMIASILRSVVKGFNIKKRIRSITSNKVCLPQPTVISHYYLFKIYGTYFFVWILILLQAYTRRLRRVICSIFYRKREKNRIVFLYNETLKRRVGFFRYMRNKVQKQVRERRLENDFNLCTVLRIRFPNACRCLGFFAMARRKCIICGEPEPRKKSNVPGDFEKCKTPDCYFVHCAECWYDVGQQCFACMEYDSDDSTEGSDGGVRDVDY
ncbi:hypothetical protein FQA39_LY01304 [Lamprigera yunnana]|nr:hypothetical protein FQA39_LY01304 [Lamprigera yunnana]